MPDVMTPATPNAQSINQALDRLAPRWTTWALQTIQQNKQMRAADMAKAMPWTTIETVRHVLSRMYQDCLVDRQGHGIYEISPLGRSAENVHRTLAAWHRAHFSNGEPMAEAQRVEDALGCLRLKGTTDVVQALSRHGTRRGTDEHERHGRALCLSRRP
ncbi:hypothetical protein Sgleb_59850 [Streptomyces glebosus]|uniref:HTH hxlR-type domain-containing protein n=1 Tax=Streptomyces glebosus TaxID=249580 RepID=A0A640T3R1_9ACTN|nr:hypothetical protein [Streptomyces glebosus]GFE17938.1 hypothetical protein Sgleb_59850 [Streptomyces glebosus]GHG46985.1 hypothetical protein GCM10010513_03140 [Streptomyces glebosus]